MFIDHFYTYRKWKPNRWGMIIGTLLYLTIYAVVSYEQTTQLWEFFSWYSLLMLILFIICAIIALHIFTIFQNWLAPKHK